MEEEFLLKEKDVKVYIGDWLTDSGIEVFDEELNKKRSNWGVFEVKGIILRKKPDLLVCGNLKASNVVKKRAYIALEIKCGHKHKDILDGFDAVLEYFTDYLWGAEYTINNKPVEISAFVLATYYSSKGYLFKEEGKFPSTVVKGPWQAYPITFTVARILWRQRCNIIKSFQALTQIRKIEQKFTNENIRSLNIPEVGVLVLDPANNRDVLLMLSKHPYHWRFVRDF